MAPWRETSSPSTGSSALSLEMVSSRKWSRTPWSTAPPLFPFMEYRGTTAPPPSSATRIIPPTAQGLSRRARYMSAPP